MNAAVPSAVQLDPITPQDYAIVAELGDTIWRAHYSSMITLGQIEYMLAGRYTPEKLGRYVDSDTRWLRILRQAGRPVGYCSYALTEQPGEMKLEQLYLLAECKGLGLGGLMLRYVEQQARQHGCDRVMLTVNRNNSGAIAVYEKSGYKVRESAQFDIGNGYIMDDFIMQKALD